MNHTTKTLFYCAFWGFILQIGITWAANAEAIMTKLTHSWFLDPIALIFLVVMFVYREKEISENHPTP